VKWGWAKTSADFDVDENKLKCVRIFLIIFFLRRKSKDQEGLSSSSPRAIIKYTCIACTLYIPIYIYSCSTTIPHHRRVCVYTLSYILYIYSSLCSPPLSQNPVYRLEENLLHGRLFGVVRIYFFSSYATRCEKTTLAPTTTALPVRPLPLTPLPKCIDIYILYNM